MQTAVLVLVLLALYGAAIVVIVWLFRRFGFATGGAVFLSLLTFGIGTGVLVALVWPLDSSVLFNFISAWLGDWIYTHAIEWLGDPYSEHAHETIPWLLRIPQVYVIASAGWCAPAGLVLAWLYAQLKNKQQPGIG